VKVVLERRGLDSREREQGDRYSQAQEEKEAEEEEENP
jgi:hypothetical protein